jgi:DNA ligase (NAD+)
MTISVGNRVFQDADALEKLVIHAATEYEINGYVEDFDDVEITDPEYDEIHAHLKKIKPDSEAFEGTSPSTVKTVGSVVVHDPPMTSIDKADERKDETRIDVYNKWLTDTARLLGKKLGPTIQVDGVDVVTPGELELAQSFKRDGVALRINYVKGQLVSAGLRPRDGVNGTDVTRHAKHIIGVPEKLPHPFTLSLNGEIECHLEDFDAINAKRDVDGEEPYKNPRGYTNGVMGRKDAKESKGAMLRVSYYSITGFDDWEKYYKTEGERARWANGETGLNLQNHRKKGYFVRMMKHSKYGELGLMEERAKKIWYYTDGVVLKVNDLEEQFELGHHGDDNVKPPLGALAWKYKEPTAEAVITGIEWKASRVGRVVPTALFKKPFVLADTSNSRATANNYGWMEERGIGVGAVVTCKKAGKIIPNICGVVTKAIFDPPKECPTCGSGLRLHISDSGNKDLRCDNTDCGAKHVHSWIHYMSNMGGKGLGTAAMELILQTGKVKTIDQLYKLSEDDLRDANRFTAREALLALAAIFVITPIKDNTKLRKLIESARADKQKIEGWKFFAALGISGAGRTAGKALTAHFNTFEEIMQADEAELESIDGIGSTTAEAINLFFSDGGEEMVTRLLDQVELILPKKGPLSNTNFVMTGNFDLGKPHWERLIEDQGGNIQSGVSRKTNYVVQQHGKTDGTPSGKEKKANDLGIEIISIPDLEKLL